MKPMLTGLAGLGAFRLAALAMVGIATLGMLAFLAMHPGREHFALLYADLDLREAAQIADSLERQHIAHQLGANGAEILVPAEDVSRARLLLARESLPSGGSIGYEIFDRGDGFTASQFQQTMNQLRAMEGELARTIRGISGVRAARVHLVLPKREPFAREQQDAQASVMLTTAGVGRLDRESVQAIVNLVAAAVPGLRPGNVSVVDSRGTLLARAGDPTGPGAAAQTGEEMRHQIELRMTRSVEEMLERTLGPGHVRAEATVDLSLDQVHESTEKYDPDGQVVRSSQTSTDNSRSTEKSDSVSVQNNLPNAAAAAEPSAGSQDQRSDETTNYEIGKTTRSLVHDQAQIRRISLAVMVDGVEQPGADGKPNWQPRSATELEQIGRLVRSAVGFDEKRGDQLEVGTMRFVAEEPAAVAAPPGLFGTGLGRAELLPLAQPLVLGLVAILALLLVLRPMVGRLTPMPEALALAGGGEMAALSGDGVRMLAGPVVSETGEELVQITHVEGQLRAASVRRVTELVERNPEESLSILRGWMQQEQS